MDKLANQHTKRHKLYGAIGTLTVHGLLVLFVLLTILKTPIPPYPEGGGGSGMGVEVNLGISENGFGSIQPDELAMPDFKVEKVETTEPAEEENLMSQESEETDYTVKPKEPTKEKTAEKSKKVKKKTKKKDKEIVKAEPVEQPVLNQKALFKKKDNTNQGVTDKAGDQGNPNGTTSSANYKGNGTGSGGGTGGGSGSGTGTGVGDGISFSLEGRNPLLLPKPEYNYQVEGKVVVEVTVDKEGKVINAMPGVKGSTTLDDNLLLAAKKAALKARFDRKPGATVQKGSITYHFMLQ